MKVDTLERTKNNLQTDLDVCRQEVAALKTSVNRMSIASMSINSELEATKVRNNLYPILSH